MIQKNFPMASNTNNNIIIIDLVNNSFPPNDNEDSSFPPNQINNNSLPSSSLKSFNKKILNKKKGRQFSYVWNYFKIGCIKVFNER